MSAHGWNGGPGHSCISEPTKVGPHRCSCGAMILGCGQHEPAAVSGQWARREDFDRLVKGYLAHTDLCAARYARLQRESELLYVSLVRARYALIVQSITIIILAIGLVVTR